MRTVIDKSVVDNHQSATLRENTIEIVSRFGRKKVFSYTIKISDYIKPPHQGHNMQYNRFKLLSDKIQKKVPWFDLSNPLHVRILESQLRAINKLLFMKKDLIAIHQYGEVYGPAQEIMSPMVQRSMTRKLGPFIRLEEGKGKANKYYIMYKYYPNAPRVLSFKRRKAIKESLPKHYRSKAALARKLSKKLFLTKTTPEFVAAIKELGYKNSEHFWQVNNNKKLPIPKIK